MLAVVEFTMSGYDHLYAFVVDHISRLIYINDLTVGKTLRQFKAGNSIDDEVLNDILDELNNPKIYIQKHLKFEIIKQKIDIKS